ncbi:MAG: PAS domain S-box protein [Candidatus Tectomicrobia bacterium]|nr:PAS domain S-box protein [Candidatus Tectomicrobia bacterium]
MIKLSELPFCFQQCSIVEGSKDALTIVDLEGTVKGWNKGAEELYGFFSEEVIGRSLLIIPDERQEELERIWEQARKGLTVKDFETQRIRKDGRIIDISLTLFPVRDRGGETVAIGGIAKDVTERNRLHKEILQAEKLAGIGQLAAGIAHQLNTPLASILLSAQMLEEVTDDKEVLTDIKKIVRQTQYCKEVVQSLLEFSIPSKGAKARAELNSLVKRIVEFVKPGVMKPQINIVMRLTEGTYEIFADKNQIEQLFFNLISNAVDAMPAGGKILVTTRSANPRFVEITLSDTGKGIPKEVLPHIFEPFFTTKEAGKGTGLGLAICQRIVQEHEGSIEVQSRMGKGTTFTIRLPLSIGGEESGDREYEDSYRGR